jgi:hypothetical protein
LTLQNKGIGAIKKDLNSNDYLNTNRIFNSTDKRNYVPNIGKVTISNGKVISENFNRHTNQHRTEILSFIKNVEYLIEPFEFVLIDKTLFTPNNRYNAHIRKMVAQKPGVYIWYDKKNKEVIYVGMAGKIKTNGQLSNHPISQRLQAPRSRDITTKKEISTNNYIPAILELLGISEIEFYILPVKENEPSAYVESILLYKYFKTHGVLPILNNAF